MRLDLPLLIDTALASYHYTTVDGSQRAGLINVAAHFVLPLLVHIRKCGTGA